jgi:hypothetical protein
MKTLPILVLCTMSAVEIRLGLVGTGKPVQFR